MFSGLVFVAHAVSTSATSRTITAFIFENALKNYQVQFSGFVYFVQIMCCNSYWSWGPVASMNSSREMTPSPFASANFIICQTIEHHDENHLMSLLTFFAKTVGFPPGAIPSTSSKSRLPIDDVTWCALRNNTDAFQHIPTTKTSSITSQGTHL